MKRAERPLRSCCVAVCLALFSAACGSTSPSRFYDLTPVETGAEPTDGGARVFLAYLELPQYLDGTTIVTRSGENELVVAEYDRWGEPVEESFARVLTKNLSLLIPSDQVFRHPWEQQQHLQEMEYLLTAAVQRFDAESGRAVLEVRWTLSRWQGESLALELETYERPVEGEGYIAIVRALSELVGDLSRDIAAAIRAAES